MSNRKIIVTEELKAVLAKINSDMARLLLQEDVDESVLSKPEKNVNYLDLSHTSKGHMSYLTGERIEKIENGDKNYWDVKSRYHARPGSVMKKLFKTHDWEIENFSTQFLSIVDPPVYQMELVKGADVAKYYHYKNYYSQSGALGTSCMKSSPSEFFDIYVENPNQINMLVMLDQHDKVMGRALVWHGEDFKLLDRIYTCNDTYYNYFYNWAKENDCYYKQHNNWMTPKHLMFNGVPEIKHLELTIDKSEFQKYPYLDTFKWLNLKTKKVSNFVPEDKTDVITISDHMGNYLKSNYFNFCDLTNNLHSSGDIEYVDYMKMNVYSGNLYRSVVLDRMIYADHSIEDKEIRDYIFNSDYDHLNDYDLINKKKEEVKKKIEIGENPWDNYWWESSPKYYYSGEPVEQQVEENEPQVEIEF
jgi:hypothetical protein